LRLAGGRVIWVLGVGAFTEGRRPPSPAAQMAKVIWVLGVEA
jgi:hypothetical protein